MIESHKQLLFYAFKCCASTAVIFSLSAYFHYHNISWCLVSAMLVLSSDSKEAVPYALNRTAANLVGAVCSILCLCFGTTSFVTLCLAYALAIVVCALCRLTTTTRTALAAVTIIMLQPSTEVLFWESALLRFASVTVGCVISLAVTLLFDRDFWHPSTQRTMDLND